MGSIFKNKLITVIIVIFATVFTVVSVHWLIISYIPYQSYYKNMDFNLLNTNVYTATDANYQYSFVPADFLKHNMSFSVDDIHTNNETNPIINLKIHHDRAKNEILNVYIILNNTGYDIEIDKEFNYINNEELTENENNEYKEIYLNYARTETEKKYYAYLEFWGI